MSQVGVVVVAAGRGLRVGGDVPKQYRALGGRPVLALALDAFLAHPLVAQVVTVVHPDDDALYRDAVTDFGVHQRKLRSPVAGGASRQASVRNGLEALAGVAGAALDLVLIHDAARPFVTAAVIGRAIEAGRAHGAAVPGVAVTDTIKTVDNDAFVRETPDRATLRAIQTPQAFGFAMLVAAHRLALAEGRDGFTDDGALAEWAGAPVHVFEGDAANVKLTTPQDYDAAERRMTPASTLLMRVGTGYDVHAFAAGDHIWLGGVRIAHDCGVAAHSDGDVVLHALTDALLGALAEGDIGVHFPPSDPRWKGASSDRFLAHAAGRVRDRGGSIDHLDATVVCEAPKIGPHREAIRSRIAAIAGVPFDRVSIKATTSEALGFTGRREGIAAQAVATVRLPAGA